MTDRNRNGHIGNFERFTPKRLTTDEIIEQVIAERKSGVGPAPEPLPDVIASFESVDLVRYVLNSKRHVDAYFAMGDTASNAYDDLSLADRTARVGIIHRETNLPIALFWVLDDGDGYEICHPSFSRSMSIDREEMLAVMRELDIPPSKSGGDEHDFVRQYDLWIEDGEWVLKEPMSAVAVRFESSNFSVHPAITDTITIYVPFDPTTPLDGNGDRSAAYFARERYREEAEREFWNMGSPIRPGFGSWMGLGDPKLLKVTGRALYAELSPSAPDLVPAVAPRP